MGIFSKKTNNGGNDPFLDALVDYSSNDPGSFVGTGTLRNSDIYAAVSIIAGDLASNPIICDTALYNKMVNERPNSLMDGHSFKYALAVEMLLNGNAFALIDRNNHNLSFVPNNQMTVTQDDVSKQLSYSYSPDGQRNIKLDATEVLHFKYFTRDGAVGISPLYALRDEQRIQRTGNDTLWKFLSQGIHAPTVLTVKQAQISPESRDKIREKFEQQNLGDNALRTIVVDDSIDIRNLPLNTDILKLVNSNDWTTRQIAKAFGLPPERLGVENEHSNQQQSNIQYLQGTLQHYEDCFVSELNFKLNQNFQYDNSRLLSLDPAQQQQLAVEGYTSGLYTRNEARKLLNLDPVINGDNFIERGQLDGQAFDGSSRTASTVE